MISELFDTREFIEAVKDKDYLEILQLADREALEAWRRLHRSSGPGKEKMSFYESALKQFIVLMRSSVRFTMDKEAHSGLFQSIREEVLAREAERLHDRMSECPEPSTP